jgi:hypothetical protein
MFKPATNDNWLNKFIPEHLKTFRANMDASWVTSIRDLFH